MRTRAHSALVHVFLAFAFLMFGFAITPVRAELGGPLQVTREVEHSGQVVYLHHDVERGQIVSIDFTGRVFVWDASSYRQVSTVRRIPFPVLRAAHISRQTHMVFGDRGRLAVIDIAVGSEPREIGRTNGVALATSASQTLGAVRAAILHDDVLTVVDIDVTGNQREVSQFPAAGLSSATLSSDGRWLAIGTRTPLLSLIDLRDGQVRWKRTTDAPITLIGIGLQGTMLIAYDNIIAHKLKRIDQLDLKDGATTASIPTAPCSVFQVEILEEGHRGFSICGPSYLDNFSLSRSKEPVTSRFLTWAISSPDSVASIPIANPNLLPFPTGILLSNSSTIIASDGDGGLFATPLWEKGFSGSVRRLAPAPMTVGRFVANESGSVLLVISPIWRAGKVEGKKAQDNRSRRLAALASVGGLSPSQRPKLDAAYIESNHPFNLPNRITLWSATRPGLTAETSSLLGFVEDASIADGRISIVERVHAGTYGPFVFAVSCFSDEDSSLSETKLISFDEKSGLLADVRKLHDGVHSAPLCFELGLDGVARVSGDATMLLAVCSSFVPRQKSSPLAVGNLPGYEVLTFPLPSSDAARAVRISLTGIPQRFEISRDGNTAAVHVMTNLDDPLTEGDDSRYELVIIDTLTGTVLKKIENVISPSSGRGLAFTSQGDALFVALFRSVYRLRFSDYSFEAVTLSPRSDIGAIAAIAVDESASRLAISSQSGVTEVYSLPKGERLGHVTHPGEVATQLAFSGVGPKRILFSSSNGGVSMFDYGNGERIVDYISYSGGDWMAFAPTGVFSASIGGEQGVTVSNGGRAVAVDQLYDLFFRPDLLRRRIISGESVVVHPDAVRAALDHPPPEVSVEVRATRSRPTATITVRDTGGGIGELRVFHNGKFVQTFPVAKLTKTKSEKHAGTRTLALTLPVARGENDYLVAALNASGTTQSRFARASIKDGVAIRPPKAYLITLGNDKFDYGASYPELRLAERSANEVSAALRKILVEAVGEAQLDDTILVGVNAKSLSIEQTLKRIESDALPDDIVVFVITTHGKILPSGELVMAARDTRADGTQGLSAARLLAVLKNTQALTQILVLDICHAGAVPARLSTIYQERFGVFAAQAGIHVLAATSQNETALAEFGNTTPFAHFLLQRLAAPASAPDVQRSLRKIAEAAAEDTRMMANKFSFNQVPSIYNFGRDFRFP